MWRSYAVWKAQVKSTRAHTQQYLAVSISAGHNHLKAAAGSHHLETRLGSRARPSHLGSTGEEPAEAPWQPWPQPLHTAHSQPSCWVQGSGQVGRGGTGVLRRGEVQWLFCGGEGKGFLWRQTERCFWKSVRGRETWATVYRYREL